MSQSLIHGHPGRRRLNGNRSLHIPIPVQDRRCYAHYARDIFFSIKREAFLPDALQFLVESHPVHDRIWRMPDKVLLFEEGATPIFRHVSEKKLSDRRTIERHFRPDLELETQRPVVSLHAVEINNLVMVDGADITGFPDLADQLIENETARAITNGRLQHVEREIGKPWPRRNTPRTSLTA